MLNNALYYPYIAFNDSTWLKVMAMYYENMYRIVSDNIIPDDPEYLASLGCKATDNWLNIPTELASNYMLFLATEIGRRNQLNLITNEWAPWTATTYFSINGGVNVIRNSHSVTVN